MQKKIVLLPLTLLSCVVLSAIVYAPQPNFLEITEDNVINVPGEIGSLQTAINQVPDGGVIEISSGTYENSGKHFSITDTGKSFAIRAAPGATVILSGKNSHPVLRFMNSNLSKGKKVTFIGLTFADGYSNADPIAGGVTMRYAKASFQDCVFRNNNGPRLTSAGGIFLVTQSSADFTNTKWIDNRAYLYGAGLALAENSLATLVDAEFRGNITNGPNHHPDGSGAGIHVENSRLYVHHSIFENNQAGYVGGAIYAIGSWRDPITTPSSEVVIDHSTFINNQAKRDPSVSKSSPTEGGAIHAENQTRMIIRDSHFLKNKADTGGGINGYRSRIEINNSILLGNQAVGSASAGGGFGGAISVHSDETGDINRPAASLTLKNVYIQGRYDTVTTAAASAAGLFIAGDTNHQYGENTPKMGSLSDNRAKVYLENVILNDLDVQSSSSQSNSGLGAALAAHLVDLNIQGVIIMNSDAYGSNGRGGGLMILNQSLAQVSDTTIIKNTAESTGAGIFAQGSEIRLNSDRIVENVLSPGVNEEIYLSHGAALFTGVDVGRGLSATGEIIQTVISNNEGIPVFEEDRDNSPINKVQYNNNQFFNTTFGDKVYIDNLSISNPLNVTGLNNLTVIRSSGVNTDKSIQPNQSLANAAIVGDILAVPPVIYTANGETDVYLGFAWSGGSATVNENAVAGNTGVKIISDPGVYTLLVNGAAFQVEVKQITPNLFIPLVSK